MIKKWVAFTLVFLLFLIQSASAQVSIEPTDSQCPDKCENSTLYLKGIFDEKTKMCVYGYHENCKYGCRIFDGKIFTEPDCNKLPPNDTSTALEKIYEMIKVMKEKPILTVMGTEYQIGDDGTIFLQLSEENKPINDASCLFDVYYPDKTQLLDKAFMIYLNDSDGLYYKDLAIPYQTGVYMLSAKCIYNVDYGNEGHITSFSFVDGVEYGNSYTDTYSDDDETESTAYSEDFSTSLDWDNWNGISYITDSTYCVDDGNDKCAEFNACDGSTLDKQSNIDLSGCDDAYFIFNHLNEQGSLEYTDCVQIQMSGDSGGNWSGNYEVFCNDNPSQNVRIDIPENYLNSHFRFRFVCENFGGTGEYGYVDDVDIVCIDASDMWLTRETDLDYDARFNFDSLDVYNVNPIEMDIYVKVKSRCNFGSSQEKFYIQIWNYTDSSWYQLPNSLIDTTSAWQTITNSFLLNETDFFDFINNTDDTQLRIIEEGIGSCNETLWYDHFYIRFKGNKTEVIDEIRGGGELHVSDWVSKLNQSIFDITLDPEEVWNYENRTLTYYPNVSVNLSEIWEYPNRTIHTEDAKWTGGTEYSSGEAGKVSAILLRYVGGVPTPVFNASCEVRIFYPNGSLFIYDNATHLPTTGIYYYDFTVPNTYGVYVSGISCVKHPKTYFAGGSFHVSEWADTIFTINTSVGEIQLKLENLTTLIENVNNSIHSKLDYYHNITITELQEIQNNLTLIYNLIGNVNNTIMTKLHSIQDEISSLNESINNLANVSINITTNITLAQEDLLNTMIALIDDKGIRESYSSFAGIGMFPLGGFGGFEEIQYFCKDNQTLVSQELINYTGDLNKTYFKTKEKTCTYGCMENACVLPPYAIWSMVFIIFIVLFLIAEYLHKQGYF